MNRKDEDENTILLNLESISNRSSSSFVSDNTSETETTVNRGLRLKKRSPKTAKNLVTVDNLEDLEELNIEKLRSRWKKFDFNMAIRNVNDSGNYQKSIMMVSVVCLFGCSFTSYLLGFIAPDPITEC